MLIHNKKGNLKQITKENVKESRNTIVLITYPLKKAGLISVSDLIKIISLIYSEDKILMVSGGEIFYLKPVNIRLYYCKEGENYIKRALKMVAYIVKYALAYEANIFITLAAEVLFPAMIILKCLRKKSIALLVGDVVKDYKIRHDYKYPLSRIAWFLSSIFVDRIVVYSPSFMRSKIRRPYLLIKTRIAWRHIVDFSVFTLSQEERNEIIIGFVGRLIPEKNLINLLLAFELLKRKYGFENARLVIVGDGPLKESLSDIIKAKRLENFVKIVGWVPRERLVDYYHRFKILVLPSYTEGLPNVILEAMACGTPVLATPVGAIPDIIKDGITGFLLDSFDAEGIARRIAEILQDEERLKKVRKLAYLYVRRNFTLEKNIQRWKAILAELDENLKL
jgi:glycosyltransferase involved in cell wall biosynthesis